jgi:hypothetical protein
MDARYLIRTLGRYLFYLTRDRDKVEERRSNGTRCMQLSPAIEVS